MRKHVQHLVSRGNRLFAQGVSWCRAEHLPVHMVSSIFSVHVLSSVSWGFEFLTQSPSAPRFMDNALRRWGRHLLGWPAGSPCTGVLGELGWTDAEHLALGRLQSFLGRTSSMAQGPPSPPPASILGVASESPRTWAHHALSISESLLPLQLAFSRSRFLTMSVVGLTRLSLSLSPPLVASLNLQSFYNTPS